MLTRVRQGGLRRGGGRPCGRRRSVYRVGSPRRCNRMITVGKGAGGEQGGNGKGRVEGSGLSPRGESHPTHSCSTN